MKWHLKRSFQVFGTGDIEAPKPTIRQIEETRADEIAEMVFNSKLKTLKQKQALAKQLGCEVAHIEWLKVSPAIQKALEIRVRALAMEKMPGIIEAQSKKAEEDVQSATFVAKAAEVLKTGGGVTVNTAVGVDNSRKGGDSEQQVAFIERMRDRQLVVLQRKLGNGSEPQTG